MPIATGFRRAARRRGLAALVCAASRVGCARGEEGPLRVGAAASLREPVEQMAARFAAANPGVKVEPVFGASSELAAQLRAGAPFDVLLSADEEIPRALADEGRVRSARAFASNRLVVIATPEVAPQLAQPADLAGPAVRRLAMPGPAVPIGHYAREWLGRRGLVQAIEPLVVQTPDVRTTLSAVDAGNADAAIVYATDALGARSARVAFEIPEPEQPRIFYVAAIASDTRQPEVAARFL
ncbi:MAG TPA: molybdate ABC transporter substrate-binding protein, partial [Myxococcota bacterium]|nr:molybdate ABC transporter substrate-binding protein [Myxococcota bacterium]